MNRSQLLSRVHAAWEALEKSYAGLPDARLTEPGASGEWSVKDVLAHVTTWEAEALKYLPLIAEGGTPPRYASEGGIDAFNARTAEHKRALSLADVLEQLHETHRRLIDYLQGVAEAQFVRETRFRRRLRLDTYRHYAEHARAIEGWRGTS
ncbi:MAG: DinB family protein [Candidatus Rokuibacteriota bacterium]